MNPFITPQTRRPLAVQLNKNLPAQPTPGPAAPSPSRSQATSSSLPWASPTQSQAQPQPQQQPQQQAAAAENASGETAGRKNPLYSFPPDFDFSSVDEYELTGYIGKGGFGMVYAGNRIDAPEVPCAIKILKPIKTSRVAREVVLSSIVAEKEMEKGQSNIVRLLDVVRLQRGTKLKSTGYALVFERIMNHGWKFSDYVQGADEDVVRQMFHDVLSALCTAHEARVFHRDIKPSNIMVRLEEKRAVLIDWNLAERIDPSFKLSGRPGTWYYKSPEVLLGAGKYDESADVWSLGTIFASHALVRSREPLFKRKEILERNEKALAAREEEEDSSNSSSLSTSDSLELLRQSAQKHDPLSGMELLFGSEEMTKFALALDTPKGTAYAQRKEAKIPRVSLRDYLSAWRSNPLSGLFDPDDDGVDLAERMLRLDPAERITAREALRHRYFRDVARPKGKRK